MSRIMMSWALAVAVALSGCEQEEEEDAVGAVQAPEPVAPLEVATPTGPEAAPDELATLRARVAELETQLASCQNATTPVGVDVPGPEAAAATPSGQPGDEPSGTQTARATNAERGPGASDRRGGGDSDTRRRDPSLLGTLLGEEDENGRRRRRDDDTVRVPNPASLLLGE